MAEAQGLISYDEQDPPSNILQFFLLVGKLKKLQRTGWKLRKIKNCETIAGHMYRMSVMAFLLQEKVYSSLNRDRCIKMALVHDLCECIVGDLTPFCGVSKEEKHRREMEAMNKLCSLVEEKPGKEILDLYKEYTEQLTDDAKAVKDLDKIDMLLQAYEYEVAACPKVKEPLDLQDFFDNTKGIENPTVLKWYQELLLHRNNRSQPPSLQDETKSNMFEFLLLIGKLKHVMTPCWEMFKYDIPSDYMYRTSIMLIVLDGESIGLNKDRCIKMALIKNLAESLRVQEEKPYKHGSDGGYSHGQEAWDLTQKVCRLAGEKVHQEITDLYREFRLQQTLEAKTVKEIERFEHLLHFYEVFTSFFLNFKEKKWKRPPSEFLIDPVQKKGFQSPEVEKWVQELRELQEAQEKIYYGTEVISD